MSDTDLIVQAVAEAIQDWTIPGVPPEVVAEAAVAAARPIIAAEAWDEGFSQGWSDAQEAHDVPQEMDRGDWPLCTPNPYRIEQEDQ